MDHDADYLFALKLQEELNREADHDITLARLSSSLAQKRPHIPDDENLNATQNLVHPEWETIDPTPDIHSLFGAFDIKFFQGKLKCVELEWSKRMYQCAGICYHRKNRMGASITIRLSEPLLKLRTRRNLIETLLHEMIHAYLFIANIREGNGGHGPNFHKIMTGINRIAGTNITVYHTFVDEVQLYKTHVWRCNGICQHRKPFYGYVKRTCNRAPGPNDNWWVKHHESCGGVFQKVSEPEPKQAAKKTKKTVPPIPSWAQTKSKPPSAGGGIGVSSMGGSGSKTIVVRPSPKTQNIRTINDAPPKSTSTYVPSSTIGSNLGNVVGFRDLNDRPISNVSSFPSEGGRLLSATATSSRPRDTMPVNEQIRNAWLQKFNGPSTDAATPDSAAPPKSDTTSKRGYVETAPTQKWEDLDDDIMIWEEKHPVIDICDDDSGDNTVVQPKVEHERTFQADAIKRELLDDLGEDDNGVIELIDDDFDDACNDESLQIMTDSRVLDDLFGDDTLMADFNNINNVIMKDPENRGNPDREIITCPICQEQMRREELSSHLEGCTGITVKVEIKPKSKGATRQLPFYKNQAAVIVPSTSRSRTAERLNSTDHKLLRQAGYSQEQIMRLAKEKAEEKDYNARIMDEMAHEERNRRNAPNDTATNSVIVVLEGTVPPRDSSPPAETVPCPVCSQMVAPTEINNHLDQCLSIEDAP